MVWLRVWRASIGRTGGDTAHDRNGHGTVAVIFRGDTAAATNLAKGAFNHTRREAAAAVAAGTGKFGKLDHFDGAGAVGEATDEAALFKCGNQAVDAGLRAQVERVLHLVEGGRHARLLQPLADEPQKFVLFARQHLNKSPGLLSFDFRDSASETSDVETFRECPIPIQEAGHHRQSLETNHERTLSVPYVFRNHLIFRQRGHQHENARELTQAGSLRMLQAAPALAWGAKGGRIKSACAAARFPSSELS